MSAMKDILTDAQCVANDSPRDAIALAKFLDAAGHTAAAIALVNLCGEHSLASWFRRFPGGVNF